jgi:hypothetical protein
MRRKGVQVFNGFSTISSLKDTIEEPKTIALHQMVIQTVRSTEVHH